MERQPVDLSTVDMVELILGLIRGYLQAIQNIDNIFELGAFIGALLLAIIGIFGTILFILKRFSSVGRSSYTKTNSTHSPSAKRYMTIGLVGFVSLAVLFGLVSLLNDWDKYSASVLMPSANVTITPIDPNAPVITPEPGEPFCSFAVSDPNDLGLVSIYKNPVLGTQTLGYLADGGQYRILDQYVFGVHIYYQIQFEDQTGWVLADSRLIPSMTGCQ